MVGDAVRFWGSLSIRQHIDSNISEERRVPEIQGEEVCQDWGMCEFEEDEVYFQDMMFFVTKGLKFKYVYRIFSDLKKANAVSMPATDTEGKMRGAYGTNQYSASSNISLYEHIVETSKSVFSLKGYPTSQLKDGALLALLHDMGKLTDYLRKSSRSFVVSGDHDEDSSKYASLVMTDLADRRLLEIFQDCLEKKNPKERQFNSASCAILKLVDFASRRDTEASVFKKEVEGNDS